MKVLFLPAQILLSEEGIAGAAAILQGDVPPAALVTAPSPKLIRRLELCGEEARAGNPAFEERLAQLVDDQRRLFHELNPGYRESRSFELVNRNLEALQDIYKGIFLVRECTDRSFDLIRGFGSRLACLTVGAALRSAGVAVEAVNPQDLILTDSRFGGALPRREESLKRLAAGLQKKAVIPLLPGSLAADDQGVTTTLGPFGGEISAALTAEALKAELLEIWDDGPGVCTADTNVVASATIIETISLAEALEFSYFGSARLHPAAWQSAVENGTDVVIRSFGSPEQAGTRITAKPLHRENVVTGISSVKDVALVNVEGSGMLGVPGTAAQVFTALAEEAVNVMMIAQASSEHSICFICREDEAARAQELLERRLKCDTRECGVEDVKVETGLEIVAVVGDKMHGTSGVSGGIFKVLGEEEISILAIAMGSSEINISFALKKGDAPRALRAVHKFFIE